MATNPNSKRVTVKTTNRTLKQPVKKTTQKQPNSPLLADIKIINEQRREKNLLGLPLKNNEWYNNLWLYCLTNYSNNPQYAFNGIVMSGLFSTYKANQANVESKSYGVFNSIVYKKLPTTNGGATSLDESFNSQNESDYGSEQWAEFWNNKAYHSLDDAVNEINKTIGFLNTHTIKGVKG